LFLAFLFNPALFRNQKIDLVAAETSTITIAWAQHVHSLSKFRNVGTSGNLDLNSAWLISGSGGFRVMQWCSHGSQEAN
jgi:hypothetical protein